MGAAADSDSIRAATAAAAASASTSTLNPLATSAKTVSIRGVFEVAHRHGGRGPAILLTRAYL
ncbi:hypothetical protein MVI01_33460 [Myxococcus virescens]|uniref:Uncharacterized protein n=1 Tax=Myxococcus virescens TaxID=83456 RepID=A0A511HDE6_9BACT|nr:hypothetical protein MVI01_33460 [Myxococcus virescens]